jgi:nicotinamide-nucleotide amidase
MFDANLLKLAEEILEKLRHNHLKIATAESCTGGLVAGCFTSIAGSADVLERGWVTYSNLAKTEELGVPAALLNQFGAVSAETAAGMVEGIFAHAPVQVAFSVTGIAGPGGEQPGKPVGLVWFGVGVRGHKPETEKVIFSGDRNEIRMAAVAHGLQMIQRVANSLLI